MLDEQTPGEEAASTPPPESPTPPPAEPAPADTPAEPQAKVEGDEVDQFFATHDAQTLEPIQAKDQAAEQPKPATPPPAPAAPAWSEQDQKLLARWKLKATDLDYLTPEHRQHLLAGLGERTSFVDRLASQVNQPAAPPPPQAAQQAAPAAQQAAQQQADLWAGMRQEYGDEFVQQFSAPINAVLQQRDQMIAQQQQALQQVQARIEQMHVEQAYSALQLPDGVEKSSDQVRQQIEAKAFELLQGRFEPGKYDWKHAIPEAAAALFNVQAIQAERARQAQAATQSRRGSAQSGVRRAAQVTPPDPDAEETREIEAALAKHGLK